MSRPRQTTHATSDSRPNQERVGARTRWVVNPLLVSFVRLPGRKSVGVVALKAAERGGKGFDSIEERFQLGGGWQEDDSEEAVRRHRAKS